MKLRYFTLNEFDSPDNPGTGKKMDGPFLQKLDAARVLVGVLLIINSGYRTKAYNKKVGGKADSAHLKGLAADIKAGDSLTRYLIISALTCVGFNRIGIGKTFVHVDAN